MKVDLALGQICYFNAHVVFFLVKDYKTIFERSFRSTMLVLLIIGAFSYLTHIACRLLDMDALCFSDHNCQIIIYHWLEAFAKHNSS